MTTDPRDAEIARYDLDLMESRMVKDQWGGEWVRYSDHAAEIARLRDCISLIVRADNLREAYHALPNDNNRIGDKRSRKGHARDAWLRAFRKAAASARATLQHKSGE